MTGEGTLRASYKVHRCVCVCPATGRGRPGPGGAGRKPPGATLAGERACKRHGEGGDTVRSQAGSPSPWGDPEPEGRPLWPLSQPSPRCHPRAGTHPARSAHDFFFFSFSACSQWGGEPSDLGGWSCVIANPPKTHPKPWGLLPKPWGDPANRTPGLFPLPRGVGQEGSRAAAGCGGSLQAVALRASSQALFRVEQLSSPRQRDLGNAGPSKPPPRSPLQPRGQLPAPETAARGAGFLGAVGLQHGPTDTSAHPPRTPRVPITPTGGFHTPLPTRTAPQPPALTLRTCPAWGAA